MTDFFMVTPDGKCFRVEVEDVTDHWCGEETGKSGGQSGCAGMDPYDLPDPRKLIPPIDFGAIDFGAMQDASSRYFS